jgi:hypothetical protein
MARSASISITSILTVFVKIGKLTSAQNLKMGRFEEIIQKYDSVLIWGHAKPAKLAKYENMLFRNGFAISVEHWRQNAGFDGKSSDVLNYRIEYIKKS